jgi:hypothetical protein
VYIFGAGVLGGVSARENDADIGIGERKCADDGWSVGLDICVGTSDISMVGIAPLSSNTLGLWYIALGRLRLTLNGAARGGGGGSTSDWSSCCCATGVLGMLESWYGNATVRCGRAMLSAGRRIGDMVTVDDDRSSSE